eukprot:TRINITY_DN23120_c0_g1_i1.p1 TRINITY_DN23120_c0_g1~~TRINITY_DN23120_c0_g1_i1.p1  ORF type:complete len:410 (+),score=98.25 TRINITY_DN23120_c0_g1_i1:45-1232(+)
MLTNTASTATRLTNLYNLLEVKPDATQDEVERGYKRVAAMYHPSRSKHSSAKERFEKATIAYCLLSDTEKRKQYDRDEDQCALPEVDPYDVFRNVHGGMPRHGRAKPLDTVVELPTHLSDFYNGKISTVTVIRDRICKDCNGLGTKREGMHGRCAECYGRGELAVVKQLTKDYTQQTTASCPVCKGAGTIVRPQDYCQTCNGSKLSKHQRTFKIRVERGMQEGDHYTFQGEGNEDPTMQLAGDVFIILTELKSDTFKRRGDHLLMSYDLTLVEALSGFHLVLNHLDGRQLVVQPTKGTCISPGQLWQVRGEGMPHRPDPSTRGNLIIQFSVTFPEYLPLEVSSKISKLLGRPPQPLLEEGFIPCTLTHADRSAITETAKKDEQPPGGRTATCQHQ